MWVDSRDCVQVLEQFYYSNNFVSRKKKYNKEFIDSIFKNEPKN